MGDSHDGLFSADQLDPRGARPVGRVERAALSSVAAAGLDERDAAAAALAVELARAVDVAGAGKAPAYAVAAAGRELRETLVRLRLDPESRRGAGDRDPIAELLDSLAQPS